MQKIGFAINSFSENNPIDTILSNPNSQFAGLWVEEPSSINEIIKYKPENRIDDLMDKCEMLIIDCSAQQKFEIISKAIKKGVVPIVNNIDGLNTAALSQLQQLANEIGVNIVFANLGYELNKNQTALELPFIGHLKRSVRESINTEEDFLRYLKNDIATALKISKLDVRKTRVYGLPACSSIPISLMIMVDFSNNSVFTYTFQQNTALSNFELEVLLTDSSKNISISFSEHNDDNLSETLQNYQNNFQNIKNIELALETSRLIDSILSKINQ